MTPDNWFVAQLKPNGMRQAETNLKRQGFECFLPKRLETKRKSGNLRTAETPLFPGYIFVNFDPQRPGWSAINATRGVTRLIVLDGRTPRPLPRDFVAGLLARSESGHVAGQAEELRAGDRVEIVAGAFAEQIATIERLDKDDRVRLLMEVMGQVANITAEARHVQKIA